MLKRLACYLALLVALATLLPLGSPVDAQEAKVTEGQRLAMFTKPAVVRIWDGYTGVFQIGDGRESVIYGGSGSGSIINPDGYILTNAHVTDLTHQGEDKGREILLQVLVERIAQRANVNPRDPDVIEYIRNNTRLIDFQHIHHVVLPNGESFPFEIKAFGAPVGQGKDVSIIKIELKNAPTLKIGDSDKIQLQDHVTVVGYPGAADTFDSGILDKKSSLEASITDGKLSAKKNTADGAPILQISAPATHGNSGGPVLSDAGEVIGLLTFRGDTVNGQEVSGFAFVVPTSTALEFVKTAGTTNQQGLADQRYREGLELYWDGYYSQAIVKLEEVKRLFPQHSEVSKLITDSQQKIAEGKERGSMLPWIIGGGGLLLVIVVLLGGGLILLIVIMKKKKKPATAGAPTASAPVPAAAPLSPGQTLPAGYGIHPPSLAGIGTGQSSLPPVGGGADKTQVVGAIGGLNTAPVGYGSVVCTSGPLAGQRFEIRPEGLYIGRDGTLSQIVINDSRVSKRHVWIGPRSGRVAVVDQGSTNGTFLNQAGSQRITEVILNPGDTVIVSEADVARFQFQK